MVTLANHSSGRLQAMLVVAALTILVLGLSVPGSLKQARKSGEFYLFSRAFVEDIPKRLTGPGRFRFVLQLVLAIILGIRNGLTDARAGRPAYIYGVLFHRVFRREFVLSGLTAVATLMLMGILVDSVCQWLILGISYPGAALAVGPSLIVLPYALARALSNRIASLQKET